MNNKTYVGMLYILLVVCMPLSVYSADDTTKDEEEVMPEGIALNVKEYQPTVLDSALVEDSGAPVYALLEGFRTDPSFDVSRIKSVSIKTTDRNPYASVYYVPPPGGKYSLENMGAVRINIKKIPKEKDVPNIIDLNLSANIKYDAVRTFGLGEQDLSLVREDEDTFMTHKELNQFWGEQGYVRAEDISEDNVKLVVYSPDLKSRKTISLKEGETSLSYSLKGDDILGLSNKKYKIKLNSLDIPAEKINLIVLVNGEPREVVAKKGMKLYPESNVRVKNIINNENIQTVELSNGKKISRFGKDCGLFLEDQCKKTGFCIWRNGNCILDKKSNTIELSINPDFINFIPGKTAPMQSKVILSATYKTQEGTPISNSKLDFECIDVKDAVDTEAYKFCNIIGEKVTDATGKVEFPISFQVDKPFDMLFRVRSQENPNIKVDKLFNIGEKKAEGTANTLSNQNEVLSESLDVCSKYPTEEVETNLNACLEIISNNYGTTQAYKAEQILNQKIIELSSREDNKKAEKLINSLDVAKSEGRTLSKDKLGDILKTANPNYKNAVSQYNLIADKYGEIRNENGVLYAVEAKLKLGELYMYHLNDYESALEAYKYVRDNFPEEEYSEIISPIQLNFFIKYLDSEKFYNYNDAVFTEGEDTIQVRLKNIQSIENDNKPSARLSIDGVINNYPEETTLPVGCILGTANCWNVELVNKNSVKISGCTPSEKDKTVLDCNQGGWINTGNSKYFSFGENKNAIIKVESIDLKRDALITIMPGDERQYSDTEFSVHIPIEKRGIQFSDEQIDSQISALTKHLEDVNNIIDKLTKFHRGLTYTCYTVFSALWLKNFVSGFTGANYVRRQVMAAWEKQCGGDTKCILNTNGKEIQNQIKEANTIYDDLKKDKTITTSNQLDLAFKKALAEEYGTGTGAVAKFYVDSFFISKTEDIDRDIENKIFEWKENDCNNMVNARMKSACESAKLNNDNSLLNEIVKDNADIYRREQKAKAINSLDPAKGDFSSIKSVYLSEEINDLKKDYSIDSSQSVPSLAAAFINDQGKYMGLDSSGDDKITVFVKDDKGQLSSIELNENNLKTINFKESTISTGTTAQKIEKGYYGTDPTKNNFDKVTDEYPASNKKKDIAYKKKVQLTADSSDLFRISCDADYYFELIPSSVGYDPRTVEFSIYKRAETNGILGGAGDLITSGKGRVEIESRLSDSNSDWQKSCKRALNDINSLRNLISKKKYKSGGLIGSGYYIEETVKKSFTSGLQCYDVMDVRDCRILFGVCDPVMCPASRFNLGGKWNGNVVKSGIIGSLVLGWKNFDPPYENLPVCVTGVIAGLQNYESVIQSYVSCLKTQKKDGKSIGVCDRIRNVYVCELLWREGLAITGLGGGVIDWISTKIFSPNKLVPTGGQEYVSDFKQNMQNTQDTVKFFTSEYATGVFDDYAGKSIEEVGTDICKAAIYGKTPGVGEFLSEITKPESPPQFTAFFDAVPYSEVEPKQATKYSIYYHIYAGENKDITYWIYLKGNDLSNKYITPKREKLSKGDYADVNLDIVDKVGYSEICVQINKEAEKCGFGKVTTSFSLDYANNLYLESQANKKGITTEEECVPSAGRITSVSSQGGGSLGDVSSAAVGTVSSGLLSTNIERRCGSENPGKGVDESDWTDVGTCGQDNYGRGLGKCWLRKSSVQYTMKDLFVQTYLDSSTKDIDAIKDLVSKGDSYFDTKNYQNAINVYDEALVKLGENDAKLEGKIILRKADAYYELGKIMEKFAGKEGEDVYEGKIELLTNQVNIGGVSNEECWTFISLDETSLTQFYSADADATYTPNKKVRLATEDNFINFIALFELSKGEKLEEPKFIEEITKFKIANADALRVKIGKIKEPEAAYEFTMADWIALKKDRNYNSGAYTWENFLEDHKTTISPSNSNEQPKQVTTLSVAINADGIEELEKYFGKTSKEGKKLIKFLTEHQGATIRIISFVSDGKSPFNVGLSNQLGTDVEKNINSILGKETIKNTKVSIISGGFDLGSYDVLTQDEKDSLLTCKSFSKVIIKVGGVSNSFISAGETRLIWPVRPGAYSNIVTTGKISQCYNSKSHRGLDIDGETGDLIVTIDDGTVVAIEKSCKVKDIECGHKFGNYILLKHNDGTYSFYAHLDSINVGIGDIVSTGDIIGKMGDTGASSGAHLHFELLKETFNAGPSNHDFDSANDAIDPSCKYLNEIGLVAASKPDCKTSLNRCN